MAGASEGVAIADAPAMKDRLIELSERVGCKYTTDPLELPDFEPDIVVEAAAQAAARQYAVPLLERGVDIMLMSVGALADPDVLNSITEAARRSGRRVYL